MRAVGESAESFEPSDCSTLGKGGTGTHKQRFRNSLRQTSVRLPRFKGTVGLVFGFHVSVYKRMMILKQPTKQTNKNKIPNQINQPLTHLGPRRAGGRLQGGRRRGQLLNIPRQTVSQLTCCRCPPPPALLPTRCGELALTPLE